MGQCTGIYKDYGIYDKYDFINKMRSGMSFEDFVEEDKKAGIRLSVGKGKSAKNKYVAYEFVIDGRKYFGTTNTGYSFDIRNAMAGQSCLVEYDDANPLLSHIAKKDPIQQGIKNSLLSMIMGIISTALGLTIIPPVALGVISIIFAVKSKKNGGGSKAMNICGVVSSCIGIFLALVSLVILATLLIYYALGK